MNRNSTKILITGATGYIGSAVARELRRLGQEVIGLARSESAAKRLREAGITPHLGDLSALRARGDGTALAKLARSVDGVIHAASSGGAETAADDSFAIEALLDGLAGTQRPFIFTSGVWVLGETGEAAATEESRVAPIPLVAWRPAHEDFVRARAGAGVRTVVIRPSLVYGDGGGIPAMLVASGREHGKVRYVGGGENRWPLIHRDDLARFYVAALERAPAGSLFHATGGDSLKVRAVAQAASIAADVPGLTESWPLEQARDALGGFADALVLNQLISAEKARSTLGWEPRGPGLLQELTEGTYQVGKRITTPSS